MHCIFRFFAQRQLESWSDFTTASQYKIPVDTVWSAEQRALKIAKKEIDLWHAKKNARQIYFFWASLYFQDFDFLWKDKGRFRARKSSILQDPRSVWLLQQQFGIKAILFLYKHKTKSSYSRGEQANIRVSHKGCKSFSNTITFKLHSWKL